MNGMPGGGVMLIFMLLFAGMLVAGLVAVAVFYGGARRNNIVKATPVIKGHVHSKP
jgi:hypothetical protein